MILALILAIVSGALCAVLVCKAIKLKLWADALAGLGGALCMLWASRIAGAEEWPLLGWPVGFMAIVGLLRFKATR